MSPGTWTRTRWLKRSATAGVLALIALGVAGFGLTVRSIPLVVEDGPGQEPLVVATEAVQWQDGYEVTRHFVGRIEARQESDLGFELGGMVREVLVDEGDLVNVGDVVAALDSDRLHAKRRELVAARDEARARLELAVLTLNRLAEALELNATSRRVRQRGQGARSCGRCAGTSRGVHRFDRCRHRQDRAPESVRCGRERSLCRLGARC